MRTLIDDHRSGTSLPVCPRQTHASPERAHFEFCLGIHKYKGTREALLAKNRGGGCVRISTATRPQGGTPPPPNACFAWSLAQQAVNKMIPSQKDSALHAESHRQIEVLACC